MSRNEEAVATAPVAVTGRTTAPEIGDRVEVCWALSAVPGLEWTEVFQFTEVAGRRGPVDWREGGGPDVVRDTSGGSCPSASRRRRRRGGPPVEVANRGACRERGGPAAKRWCGRSPASTGCGRGRSVATPDPVHRDGSPTGPMPAGAWPSCSSATATGTGGAGPAPGRGARRLPGGHRPRRPTRRDRGAQARGAVPARGGHGGHRRGRGARARRARPRPGRGDGGRVGRGRAPRAARAGHPARAVPAGPPAGGPDRPDRHRGRRRGGHRLDGPGGLPHRPRSWGRRRWCWPSPWGRRGHPAPRSRGRRGGGRVRARAVRGRRAITTTTSRPPATTR